MLLTTEKVKLNWAGLNFLGRQARQSYQGNSALSFQYILLCRQLNNSNSNSDDVRQMIVQYTANWIVCVCALSRKCTAVVSENTIKLLVQYTVQWTQHTNKKRYLGLDWSGLLESSFAAAAAATVFSMAN